MATLIRQLHRSGRRTLSSTTGVLGQRSISVMASRSQFSAPAVFRSRPMIAQKLLPSRTYTQSSQPTPERDPSHPSLFYHPLPSGPVYALTFIENPPHQHVPRSRTILGWVQGSESEDSGFQENPAFRQLLHECIQSAMAEPGFDAAVESDAMQRGEGWMNISDTRNVPALNRVGDPDDLIGSVMVQDGKIIASTYQPMPTYRICTGDGPTRLSEGLAKKLEQYSQREWESEIKSQ